MYRLGSRILSLKYQNGKMEITSENVYPDE